MYSVVGEENMKTLVISLLLVIGLSGCGTGSSEYGGYTPSFPSYFLYLVHAGADAVRERGPPEDAAAS